MSILKKPYEISLWEDVLTFVVQDGDTITEYEENLQGATGKVIAQYYKERKICIIGSDTMDTPIRATQPKLVSKVNGENVLTFNMYSHYYDVDADDYFENPFLGLLVNERKVKLRYGEPGADSTKWYDLVIKNIQENSESKTYTYTAKDLFVNELSKSGFNLVFDAELENNMGNAETLAERILEESDWKLRPSGEVLKQTIDEPLYEILLNKDIELINMENEDDKIVVEKGKTVYAFYNNIVNKNPYVQFLYAEKYEIDDDHIISNSPNWYLDGVTYNEDIPDFTDAEVLTVSDKYRGRRLVRKARTEYDASIDKYVTVYEKDDKEIYGYTETDYVSPANVRSYITNPTGYESTTGWQVGGVILPKLELACVPDPRDIPVEDAVAQEREYVSCLKFEKTEDGQILFNSGIVDSCQQINGFIENEQYVFRIKYGQANEMGEHGPLSLKPAEKVLTFKICEYTLNDGVYTLSKENVYFEGATAGVDYDYENIITTCKKSLPYSSMIKMSNSLGLFIEIEGNGAVYIEDVQFFPYATKGDGSILLPNEIAEAQVVKTYYYYYPNKDYKSIDEVVFIYKGNTPSSEFLESYNNNGFEKIRSITASESNRFNLLQELCEIFECWAKFEIEHKETGEIELDENYRQKKWVSFHEYIGNDNYVGFKYGINLKSIQRTIESDAIVSKMIVKNNSNEFATDGFCAISRANENSSGENFLLDFSYYIQQGMLGLAEITNDLYLDTNGYIGYYKHLKRLNTLRDQYIQEQSGLLTDITEYSAAVQTYDISVSEAQKSLVDKRLQIERISGYSYEALLEDKGNSWWDDDTVNSLIVSISRLKTVIKNHQTLLDSAKTNLDNAQNKYDKITRILSSREESEDNQEERLLLEKDKLNSAFYKKYSRFLQEGSWISEDYIDDNLYYLDAQSTLHTSSQPKITYNISVLELSQLPGYENFTFALGDKTTMEDTEFFGWVWKDGVQTPYQEEIVVTEMTLALDSPEQNQIKVQNYKTQFEDLFQRITATTQSVEYSTGQYQRAAGIVETDGTIKVTTLQNSIANNALTLQNAKDQSVVWDETGITTTSLSKPSEIVRIVSGGVFLSVDGGDTWNTGITGSGINANYITSGQINTEKINVMNGSFPSFRWDGNGINAFAFSVNEQTGAVSNFNYGKFVRLDQYGLYGINGYSEFNPNKEEDGIKGEDKIWKNANFALTWKGFMLKNSYGDGYVSIDSVDDFIVSDGNKNRIQIGNINNNSDRRSNPLYGIRISDAQGAPVMETSENGDLWLRNELKVGTEETSTVKIGYLDETRDDTNIHEVFHAGNGDQEFIVYEDGKMVAQGAEFHGAVYATGGQIGNLKIGEVEDAVGNMNSIAEATRKLDISSNLGYNFKVGSSTVAPSALELVANATGFEMNETSIIWRGTTNFEQWQELGSGKTYILSYEQFKELQKNEAYYIKVNAESTDGVAYEHWVTIMAIFDGEKGETGEPGKDANSYFIETSQAEILKFVVKDQTSYHFSPEILKFSIYKRDLSKEEGKIQITNLNLDNLSLFVQGNNEFDSLDKSSVTLANNEFSFELANVNAFSDREETVLKIQYKLEDSDGMHLIDSFLRVRYGLNSDMASLSLEAGGIVAAIQNTKMEFSADGLLVKNGGIKIQNNAGDNVLSADTKGNLTLTGTIYANAGEFTGKVIATEGSFKGSITATEGKIGGFEISNGMLVSTEGNRAIQLNGATGEIIAQNISLGIGATISQYIQLGDNVRLYNPDGGMGSPFIEVTDDTEPNIKTLTLNNDGTIKVGDGENTITIDGKSGTISSVNSTDKGGWMISNEESVFSNITVGGSIKAATFEYGAVQSVGGMIVVRPSSRIVNAFAAETAGQVVLKLESMGAVIDGRASEFVVGDHCRVNTSYYEIISVDIEGSTITIEGNPGEFSTLIGKPVINFGKTGSVGIGINASNNGAIITPNSISVFNFDENINSTSAKIILGKLPDNLDSPFAGTYGLYAENVSLYGALTTGSGNTYSGMNTISINDAPMSTKVFGEKGGEILLWAGAADDTKTEIEGSPFYVDRNGNVFANSGYFKGAIISESTIQASEIKTAIITGWKDSLNAALTIKDAKLGIDFQDNDGKSIFTLADEQIKAYVNSIIFNSNFKIDDAGALSIPETRIGQENEGIEIGKNSISYSKSDLNTSINFEDGFKYSHGTSSFEVNSQETKVNTDTLYIKEIVKYGELMEYKPVLDSSGKTIGYDLYIDEE